jgi:hypothetical protein
MYVMMESTWHFRFGKGRLFIEEGDGIRDCTVYSTVYSVQSLPGKGEFYSWYTIL